MIQVISKNEWVSLNKIIAPEKGCNGYYYLHEERCSGKIVSILPFRRINNSNKLEFLLRHEITPCWNINTPTISSITGGVDKGHTINQTVLIELEEEAGYKVKESELIPIGECFGTKSSDTIYYIFSVDLTGKVQNKTLGDGSELEAKAHCEWHTSIMKAEDPLVYTAYMWLLGEK